MSYLNLKTIVLLAMAFMFLGCAGLPANALNTNNYPIRQNIQESFHAGLQDQSLRKYLEEVDPSTLPPDRDLEVYLLREMAKVKDVKGLKKAFDHLWEKHEQVRTLIYHSKERTGFLYPLAEIYYLLSVIPEQNWHKEAAERLYQETFRDLKPHQISGYALHFYTMALLENGKYDVAMVFLKRLEHFTSPPVYLEDLTIALDQVIDGKGYKEAAQIMALICQFGAKDNVKFPDKEMCNAVSLMKEAGKFKMVQETLLPLVKDHSQIKGYLFVKLLQESPSPAYTGTSADHKKLKVRVQVIKAAENSVDIDPELIGIGEKLKETLKFSSFRLVEQKTFYLQADEIGEMSLPGNNVLRIVPITLKQEKSRIEVSIIKGVRKAFHTVIESVDGGITTIGGPKSGEGMIFLRVATFCSI